MSPEPTIIFRRILALLRVRSAIGGLEVGDAALRFAAFADGRWQMHSLRLPPGIIQNGVVQDYAQFVEALRALKAQMMGESGANEPVSVVVSLGSISIYSQVFSLPIVAGENLEKAIQLNVQMISPDDAANMYSGWQLINHDQKSVRLEVLSAFINRAVVDDFRRAFAETGFVPYALESRALSLARTVRMLGSGFDNMKSYVFIGVDAIGVQLLVIRHSQLYFDYFTPWREAENENHEIAPEAFQGLIVRNLYQVLNFSSAHWVEPIDEILVSAPGMAERVMQIVSGAVQIPARELTLTGDEPIQQEWYLSVGSGLRGLLPRRKDMELSLLGSTAREEYEHHQLVRFLGFWRIAVPAALGVLLAALFTVQIFLVRSDRALAERAAQAASQTARGAEVETARARVTAFNTLASQVRAAKSAPGISFAAFTRVEQFFAEHEARIVKMEYGIAGERISIQARSATQDAMLSLKAAMDARTDLFAGADIPLLGVQADSSGVAFRISFSMISSAAR